jgi:hypothetical protein
MMITQTHGQIEVAKVVNRGVLAGRASGQADQPKLAAAATAAAIDGRVRLDFTGVEVLSSSYFDAAIWPLWTATAELYPALAKVPPSAIDDIEIVLKANGAALWWFADDSRPPAPLGPLDAQLRTTLDHVMAKGEATAGDLLEVDRSIGATAWSNRLAALHQIRLLKRRKDGRRLLYSPAWKE